MNNRKIRGKRLVFLILTIFFGFGVSLGALVAVVEDSEAISMVFTCVPPFILFLWLYLRKGKVKKPSQSMEISKTPQEHKGANIPQESAFLLYATMKRKGEKLPEGVQVSIEDELITASIVRFENKCSVDHISELATDEWLKRCSFPIGMDENGNLFELEDVSPQIENADIGVNPKTCCLFSYNTVDEAMKNSKFEVVDDFGGEGEGYSFNDGNRKLCRCKNCGALFLNYKIRFLAMTYEQDEISYNYFLPVANRNEALEYIDSYIGSVGMKDSYEGKKIWFDGSKWCWKK